MLLGFDTCGPPTCPTKDCDKDEEKKWAKKKKKTLKNNHKIGKLKGISSAIFSTSIKEPEFAISMEPSKEIGKYH